MDMRCWAGAASHWDTLISHQARVDMKQSCQAAWSSVDTTGNSEEPEESNESFSKDGWRRSAQRVAE